MGEFLFRDIGHGGGHTLHGTISGVAVGAALTMPALSSLMVFTSIALGLSTPYLLLAFFPAWMEKLPKPGAWMESFKQFMAFPIYATVAWLIWTLDGLI